MRIIIDPFFFWTDPSQKITPVAQKSILDSFDLLIRLNKAGYQICATLPLWTRINTELMRRLAHSIPSHALQPRIHALNGILQIVAPPPQVGQTWGIKTLFTFLNFPDPQFWMGEVAAIAGAWINSGIDFQLAMKLIEGRNLKRQSVHHCIIWEKTHWNIYIQQNGQALAAPIPCVSSMRNIEVPWTRRYDDYLPDTADAAGLAFVPKQNWDDVKTKVIKTVESKPTWVDINDNGWSDTNTPGQGHHWDVYLTLTHLRTKFRSNYVNITKWGTNDRKKQPGSIHH